MIRITKAFLPSITRLPITKMTGTTTSETLIRAFATGRKPGSDPLDVIRKECMARNLCDEHGYRRPGVHWVISIAISPDDVSKVGICACLSLCIHEHPLWVEMLG